MFTLYELFDVIVMTIAVGFIFMDVFRPKNISGFSFEDFKISCLVTAPAIILHELMHKLVAVFFGLQATFHAAYNWLVLGIVLKLIGGFVFFVPGYVSTSGISTPLQELLISFAGPGTNLALYLISRYLLAYKEITNKKFFSILCFTKHINGFLFVFNIIPLPFFDGGNMLNALIKLVFG
ncbi:M50 family metallopeptidase [Candidatus Woesearchaeota archaeon]|nr:M50 family metallopeptidase [Candidatus Woesearchaeota archaeon]